jgi:hypothetical protein
MSINSSVCSINKNASLFDAINIIINENIEELLVWDETLNRWIWMLTIVDAIRLIMHSLKTIINQGKVSILTLIPRFHAFPAVQGRRHEEPQILESRTVHKVTIYQAIGNRSCSCLSPFKRSKLGKSFMKSTSLQTNCSTMNHLIILKIIDSLKNSLGLVSRFTLPKSRLYRLPVKGLTSDLKA